MGDCCFARRCQSHWDKLTVSVLSTQQQTRVLRDLNRQPFGPWRTQPEQKIVQSSSCFQLKCESEWQSIACGLYHLPLLLCHYVATGEEQQKTTCPLVSMSLPKRATALWNSRVAVWVLWDFYLMYLWNSALNSFFSVACHLQRSGEGGLLAPDRLFKVVLVGNSSVGKTSLLRSFCEGRFLPSTIATVGEKKNTAVVLCECETRKARVVLKGLRRVSVCWRAPTMWRQT